MRIRELRILNFRKIQDLTVVLPPGLTVLVGANNAGKSTIIDALRLMLFPSREYDALRLTEDDFRRQDSKSAIEITYTFTDLSTSDEARFLECLVKVGNNKFEMRVNVRVELNPQSHRPNYKWWGGETEGGSLPNNFHDNITSVYLRPLRDPESGLRPGQSSQIARLVRRLTPAEKESEFEKIAKEANEDIRKLQPVKDSCEVINTQITDLAGEKLAQKADLIFNDPSFVRIIGGLFPEIDGLPFELNGLGYHGLYWNLLTIRRLPDGTDPKTILLLTQTDLLDYSITTNLYPADRDKVVSREQEKLRRVRGDYASTRNPEFLEAMAMIEERIKTIKRGAVHPPRSF